MNRSSLNIKHTIMFKLLLSLKRSFPCRNLSSLLFLHYAFRIWKNQADKQGYIEIAAIFGHSYEPVRREIWPTSIGYLQNLMVRY